MDYLIFFFIFFIFLILIIYGLPFKRTYFNNQIADLQQDVVRENFQTSSDNDVKQGASTFYDWGLRGDNKDDVPEECDIEPAPKSKSCSGGKCLGGKNTYVQNDYYVYPEEKKPEQPTCGNCDAYKCKNIDRYVLKSSVPACPDMSEYALKSMVKPCPDLKNYVLKNEIPPCPEQPDLTKYVLKSQVPACPTPVVCPDCPVCPPAYKYIQDDPRFKNWLIRFEDDVEEKINKLYIRKTDSNKNTEESFKKGLEEGKNNAYKAIAQGAGPDVLKKCLHPGSGGSGKDSDNKKSSGGQNIGYLNDNQKNQQRDQNRDRKDSRDSRDTRDYRDARDSRDSRDTRDYRDSRDTRDYRDSRDSRDNRDSRDSRDSRDKNNDHSYEIMERNRLADLDKRLEFDKNNRREENLSKTKNQKINTTSGDNEFVLGWDPTSLGFGSINYQMKEPNIK